MWCLHILYDRIFLALLNSDAVVFVDMKEVCTKWHLCVSVGVHSMHVWCSSCGDDFVL